MSKELAFYRDLLADIKTRLRQSQHRAVLSANAEMLRMYWDIGRLIAARQKQEGWGTGVIPRLAVDLKNELPEQKGFSATNINRMLRFYREYPVLSGTTNELVPPPVGKLGDPQNQILPPPVGKLAAPQLPMPTNVFFALPWAHHVVLFEKSRTSPFVTGTPTRR